MVGKIFKQNYGALIIILIIFLLAQLTFATLDNESPTSYNDTGITTNISFAYDKDFSTFALVNISSGNMSIYNFSIGSHLNSEAIRKTDAYFDIYVVNSVDDQWALQYSDDNGTTFYDLRTLATGNMARQNLSYSQITEHSTNQWTWNEIRDKLLFRVILKTVGAPDSLSIYLYELYALVTYDVTPPTIFLQSPPTSYVSRTSNVSLFFNASDDLNGINNCTFIIGNKANMSLSNVEMNTTYEFLQNFTNGQYPWSINCTDNSTSKLENNSEQRTLIVEINHAPNVTNVVSTPNINLAVSSTKDITCNATLEDWNNVSDIQKFNATFYHESVNETYQSGNSTIYRNNACINISMNSTAVNISCNFSLWYYAKPGNWYCNVTARDGLGEERYGIGNTTVNSLYAINITPALIDYGVLAAGDNSTSDVTTVVENLGNMEIDISLDGYGVFDGDDLAMSCSEGVIGVDYEKYYLLPGAAYTSMISLTDDSVQLDDFNLVPRNTTFNGQKSVYWKMGVPKPRKGNCTGFVTFAAVQS